jgi:hypothetical protein
MPGPAFDHTLAGRSHLLGSGSFFALGRLNRGASPIIVFVKESVPDINFQAELDLITDFSFAKAKEIDRIRAVEFETQEKEKRAAAQAAREHAIAEAQRRNALALQEAAKKAAIEHKKERARQQAVKERLNSL